MPNSEAFRTPVAGGTDLPRIKKLRHFASQVNENTRFGTGSFATLRVRCASKDDHVFGGRIMKILLFGASGQVGWELQRSLACLGPITALDLTSRDPSGDFTNLASIEKTVRSVKPDLIVNAAAYTAVDKAESERELCRTVNAEAPGVLAREAKTLGAWLVHYSTDYVFDGSGSTARKESDKTGPLNFYGQTKLDSENLIMQSGCKYLTFRTSWIFAARGANFVHTILRLAKERETLTIVDDQIGAPTGADLVADVTAAALRMAFVRPELSGLYNLTSTGETSWHGYADFIVREALESHAPLRAVPANVKPVPSTAFKTAAVRPLNSRLDTNKIQKTFHLSLPNWKAGVSRTLNEIFGAENLNPRENTI